MIFIDLKRRGHRGKDKVAGHELSQAEFQEVVREELKKSVPDAKPQVQDPSQQGFGGGGSKGFPAEFMIQGPDWRRLGEFSKEIIAELKKTGVMTDVESDLLEGAPELRILPNRQKGSERGVSVEAIGSVINAMLGGVVAGSYEKQGHRNDVRVKMIEDGRSPTAQIKDLMVRNNRGQLVPLISVVDIVEEKSPATVSRKNRQRSIMIYGNLGKDKSQQEVLKEAEVIAKKIMSAGGEGYRFNLVGSAEEFMRSFMSLLFALFMGFVVAYMVLASQFDSFIDPITVFMALPFSFSGAFLGLLIGRQSMNMFSMIGLILLMGIVKKNSILLVDFTHQKRKEGKRSVHDALIDACPTRLRPILMTSLATIAGAMPAAMAFGPGAESRRPMATAVIGGVIVSTFLTLYVVPCVYSLLSRFERKHAD
jgi:HAE1 family hydrophobic/amphiphilic exporter-1